MIVLYYDDMKVRRKNFDRNAARYERTQNTKLGARSSYPDSQTSSSEVTVCRRNLGFKPLPEKTIGMVG